METKNINNDYQLLDSCFREFPSIDGIDSKIIKHFEKLGYLHKSIEWIAMEKIHGANLSFITDGVSILTAKRSGIINTTENFFGSSLIMKKYYNDIIEIFNRIKNDNSGL